MTYLLLFVAVTGAVLGILAFWPARGKSGVKSRLDRLETVGGALVPVEEPKKRPRKPRARKRQVRVPRGTRLAMMGALLLVPTWMAWGLLPGVFVVSGFVLVLGLGDMLWKGWSMRMVRRQLPAAVRILAERLRATNSFFTALEAVEKSGMQPVASQFGRVRQDVARGVPEEQALERFATRVPILEAEILAKAISYHPQKGQRLAAALDQIAELMDGRRRLIGVLDGAWGGG
jgi:Flp pilus assembly protein TadB